MLICITGVDGCGKGTQVYLLKEALKSSGFNVTTSKAYGDAEKESFAHFFKLWDDIVITFVFQGLHRQQYINAKKALEQGRIVIADRWDESYRAYHSMFGFLALDEVMRNKLNEVSFGGLVPDLTFLLNISISKAVRRMQERGRDFFDSKDEEYHHKMAKAYLQLAKEKNWEILNGEETPERIHRKILQVVLAKLGES